MVTCYSFPYGFCTQNLLTLNSHCVMLFLHSSEAEGAAVGGMCHTFIVIETDSDSYILERLLEGVRLSNVTASLHEVTKDAYKWSHSEVPLSSKAVAKWVLSESNVDYNLFTNNCIHFVKDFGRMFTREDDFRMNFVEFAKFVISQMPTVIVEGGTKDEKNCLLTTY